jgi:hypothetical protein
MCGFSFEQGVYQIFVWQHSSFVLVSIESFVEAVWFLLDLWCSFFAMVWCGFFGAVCANLTKGNSPISLIFGLGI